MSIVTDENDFISFYEMITGVQHRMTLAQQQFHTQANPMIKAGLQGRF